MARIMDYASDIGVLLCNMLRIMNYQKMACINEGEIATRLGLEGVHL